MPKQKSFKYNDPKIVTLLKSVQPFKELTDNELTSLIPIMKKLEYQKDEIVVREGKRAHDGFVENKQTKKSEIQLVSTSSGLS